MGARAPASRIVVRIVVAAALGGCQSPASKQLPEGFDVCETPLTGDEGPNGLALLVQVDVGRTADPEGEDDDGGEEPADPSPFALDGPYSAARGYGFVGRAGEAVRDPSWTTWAWPYGGRGDQRIHLATRVGFDGYRFDLPDGVYAVTWHLIEKSEHWSGYRKNDLLVEGAVAVAGYDIFAEVGNRFMVAPRALAKVEDGALELAFADRGNKEPVTLSALEVEAIDPDDVPPAAVTGAVARGGYGQAIISWDPPPERDIRGVNVWRAERIDGRYERVNPRVVTARHFVDHTAEIGRAYYYELVAQDLFCNDAAGVIVGPVVIRDHAESSLPVFDIEITDAALEGLTRDVSRDLYVPAVLRVDGATYEVELRNRGASTRYLSKPNFKIRLKGQAEHEGRNGFKLNSEVVDPRLITERLAYEMFAAAGALAPRARYVHVVLAGRYLGVYTEVQEVDRRFFADNGIDDAGNLYRLGGGLLNPLESAAEYAEVYEKKTNEDDPAGHADLIDFVAQLNRTPEHEFAAWADTRFAADEYLDFLAVNLLVANYDLIDGNQYLYHDTALDRWHHVPWDYNNGTFADPWSSVLALTAYDCGMWNPWWFTSLTRCYANAELRGRLADRIDALSTGALDPAAIRALAEALVERARVDVSLDPWMVAWERDQGYATDVVPSIHEFAVARRAFLAETFAGLEELHGPLVINELQALNAGATTDEHGEADPWVELYNRGTEVVGLAGLCLTPDLREPDAAHCFGEGIQVAPGATLLLWADGEPSQGALHLGFELDGDGGELGLLAAGEGDDWKAGASGVQDILFYGTQVPGESYGRLSNGGEVWGSIGAPTPGS